MGVDVAKPRKEYQELMTLLRSNHYGIYLCILYSVYNCMCFATLLYNIHIYVNICVTLMCISLYMYILYIYIYRCYCFLQGFRLICSKMKALKSIFGNNQCCCRGFRIDSKPVFLVACKDRYFSKHLELRKWVLSTGGKPNFGLVVLWAWNCLHWHDVNLDAERAERVSLYILSKLWWSFFFCALRYHVFSRRQPVCVDRQGSKGTYLFDESTQNHIFVTQHW